MYIERCIVMEEVLCSVPGMYTSPMDCTAVDLVFILISIFVYVYLLS